MGGEFGQDLLGHSGRLTVPGKALVGFEQASDTVCFSCAKGGSGTRQGGERMRSSARLTHVGGFGVHF